MRNAVMLRKFNYPAQNSSQWSHSSFRWRIILGLCEKSRVEKRDLTTGKLNIKPSARERPYLHLIYMWILGHILNIYWTKYRGEKVSHGKEQYHYYYFYFPVQSSNISYEKLISLPLHSIGMLRQTVRHQGVPKSTSSIHGGRVVEQPRYCPTSAGPRAFHK